MLDREQIEAINRREECLLKAHALARRIEERTRRLMHKHGLHPRQGRDGGRGTAEAERSRMLPPDAPFSH
jgi:hypothetical protein